MRETRPPPRPMRLHGSRTESPEERRHWWRTTALLLALLALNALWALWCSR